MPSESSRRILVPFTRPHLADARIAAAAALRGGADEVIAVSIDADLPDPHGFADGVRVTDVVALGTTLEALGRSVGAYGVAPLPHIALPTIVAALSEPDDAVVVLGPHTRVLGPLAALWSALDAHDAVLVPTLLDPSYDAVPELRFGLFKTVPPSPSTIVDSKGVGAINDAVLGVRRRATNPLLDAWPLALGRVSHYDPYRPRPFRAWLDAAATLDGVHILRDPGTAVAYFNLRERPIDAVDGVVRASGAPLSLLDLRGHDPRLPRVFAPGQYIGFLSDAPALIEEMAAHAGALLRAGWTAPPTDPRDETPRERLRRTQGRWATTDTGMDWSTILRRRFRIDAADGLLPHSPFTPAGEAEAIEVFSRPGTRGTAIGINALLWEVWQHREDVQGAYPLLDGADGPGFVGWVWAFGREQELIPDALVPRWAERFASGETTVEPAAADADADAIPESTGESAETATPAGDGLGVNVAGYFSTEIGLGESARLLVRALETVDIEVQPIQGRLIPVARQAAQFAFSTPDEARHDISLLIINGDSIPEFARDVGEGFFEGRYTIGFWWWEVDPYPAEHWNLSLPWVDEIWVGTKFVHDLIEPFVDVPVVHVRTPVAEPPAVQVDRAHFGIDEDETVFLYVFNYQSAGVRKNPIGLIEAFRAAFTPEDNCRLILKSVGQEHRIEEHEEVRVAAYGRPDITLIDRYLDAAEKDSLVGLADCYVSPHRSEGFGYTLAEAMAYGKPVICTNYGGVTDFANEHTALLVDWTPIRVGPFAPPYPADGVWADPDPDQLVAHMRWVKEHPEEAAALGAHAREVIRTTHSFTASGTSLHDRLEAIRERLAGGYVPRSGVHPDVVGTVAEPAAAPAPAPAAAPPADAPAAAPSESEPVAAGPRTARRRAFERAARTPAVAKARRAWWGMMDRAVAARTRPAIYRLNDGLQAVREQVERDERRDRRAKSELDLEVRSLEQRVQREVRLLESQVERLGREVHDVAARKDEDAR